MKIYLIIVAVICVTTVHSRNVINKRSTNDHIQSIESNEFHDFIKESDNELIRSRRGIDDELLSDVGTFYGRAKNSFVDLKEDVVDSVNEGIRRGQRNRSKEFDLEEFLEELWYGIKRFFRQLFRKIRDFFS